MCCRIFIVHELPFPIGTLAIKAFGQRAYTEPVRWGQTTSLFWEPKVTWNCSFTHRSSRDGHVVHRRPDAVGRV